MKKNVVKIQCDVCGNYVKNTRVVHGENICDACLETDYIWCDHCECYHERAELLACEWCNSPICDENVHEDCCGTVLCSSCWGVAYTCDDCGAYVHRDDIFEFGGDIYCESCNDRHNKNARTKKVGYSFKPTPIFYGPGPVYFGVELEVDGADYEDADDCIDEILAIVNCSEWKIYAKDDSSLNDGFEIVSMPATLEYHLKCFPWKSIMDRVLEYGFRSHDTQTCGLHIHISRNAFDNGLHDQEYGISNLIYLSETFWDQIKCFSRRTDEQIAQWAKRYGFGRFSTTSLFKEAQAASFRSRYYAINLQNDSTIEIRIFRGSLNYNTFAATLQFCQLLVDTANAFSLEELQMLTWQDLVSRGREYTELSTYLKQRGLYAQAS